MVLKELKCQHCGHRSECEVLEDEEARQRPCRSPVTCPKCQSAMIETIRILRRVGRGNL
jgi:hypothetical protein